MITDAKIVKKVGKSMVVSYVNDGLTSVIIIDNGTYLSDTRPGATIQLTEDQIATATPYNVEWRVVYPEGTIITPEKIQEVFIQYGLYTFDDVLTHSQELNLAVHDLVMQLAADIIRKSRNH